MKKKKKNEEKTRRKKNRKVKTRNGSFHLQDALPLELFSPLTKKKKPQSFPIFFLPNFDSLHSLFLSLSLTLSLSPALAIVLSNHSRTRIFLYQTNPLPYYLIDKTQFFSYNIPLFAHALRRPINYYISVIINQHNPRGISIIPVVRSRPTTPLRTSPRLLCYFAYLCFFFTIPSLPCLFFQNRTPLLSRRCSKGKAGQAR